MLLERIRRDGLVRIRDPFLSHWFGREFTTTEYGPLADIPYWTGNAAYVVPPDPHAKDGEWHATITMVHEVIEWEGMAVPLFEGDIERQEWEQRRRELRNPYR